MYGRRILMSKIEDILIPIMVPTPVIVVDTHEDSRFVLDLLRVKNNLFDVYLGSKKIEVINDYDSMSGSDGGDFEDQLRTITSTVSSGVSVHLFKYTDLGATDLGKTRAVMLKDVMPLLRMNLHVLIFMSPNPTVDHVLQRNHTRFNYGLMDREQISGLLSALCGDMQQRVSQQPNVLVFSKGNMVRADTAYKLEYTKEEMDHVSVALTGLTKDEVVLTARSSLKKTGKFDPVYMMNSKRDLIEKSGLLEWEDPVPMESVGGLDEVKEWLITRAPSIYDEKAAAYGLRPPRGTVLLGPPGTGKSLIAKAAASLLGVSLISLNMGRIMDRWVGGSEGNMLNALKVIEANAPCVLWVDEVEKALSGVQSSGFTDSGTFSRVFGILLKWLQERKQAVFLVATCNAMIGRNNELMLPPEFQRKGRIDEIWYVDIPNREETSQIIKIQLKKVGRDADAFDVDKLSKICYTEGSVEYSYTGAEWESAIMDAMFTSFKHNREVTSEDISASIRKTVPMSYSMRETINQLRKFGHERCRAASSGVPQKVVSQGGISLDVNKVHL
jgi:ATP-dependent 26S proteasome regulatory subunit